MIDGEHVLKDSGRKKGTAAAALSRQPTLSVDIRRALFSVIVVGGHANLCFSEFDC